MAGRGASPDDDPGHDLVPRRMLRRAVLARRQTPDGWRRRSARNSSAANYRVSINPSVADRLLNRARDALARTDGVVWRDKDRVVRAFAIAATTLGT